jgi:hypothetical protein
MLRGIRRAAFLILAAASCHSSNPKGPEPENQIKVRIENRSSLDMDISVRRNNGRSVALGFAPGGETTTFALAPSVTTGTGVLRFEAKPVRSSGQTQVSEPFPVRPGEEIFWSISPQ